MSQRRLGCYGNATKKPLNLAQAVATANLKKRFVFLKKCLTKVSFEIASTVPGNEYNTHQNESLQAHPF
jgi:hypothetical protein